MAYALSFRTLPTDAHTFARIQRIENRRTNCRLSLFFQRFIDVPRRGTGKNMQKKRTCETKPNLGSLGKIGNQPGLQMIHQRTKSQNAPRHANNELVPGHTTYSSQTWPRVQVCADPRLPSRFLSSGRSKAYRSHPVGSSHDASVRATRESSARGCRYA